MVVLPFVSSALESLEFTTTSQSLKSSVPPPPAVTVSCPLLFRAITQAGMVLSLATARPDAVGAVMPGIALASHIGCGWVMMTSQAFVSVL